MKKVRSVLWFDDEFDDRQPQIRLVAKSLGLKLINAWDVGQGGKGRDSWPNVVEKCIDKCQGQMISLIVVDDNLSINSKGTKSFDKGSSLCGALRERFKDVPIVGVSNAELSLIGREQMEEYSYFWKFLDIKKGRSIAMLRSLVKGFEDLRRLGGRPCEEAVLALMNVPKVSVDTFRKIIPVALRSGNLSGNARAVFKWLDEEVFAFQGVLVDSMNIASMVGLKEDYFLKKIASKWLCGCEYKGVFSSFWGTWFWRQEALTALAKAAKDYGAMELSHYCAALAPKEKSQWAVCANCKQPYTELAADAERNGAWENRVPAHRKCVVDEDVPHPIFFNSKYVIAKGGRR